MAVIASASVSGTGAFRQRCSVVCCDRFGGFRL